ncbi:MAG: DUF5675 family protein [Bacteroidota bacterium]
MNSISKIRIQQFGKNENVIFSNIYLNDVFICFCFENAHYPIPKGIVIAIKYLSPHLRRTVLLLSVPNHSYVEMHPANIYSQLRGCFATCESITNLGGIRSAIWLDKLLSLIPNSNEIEIEIC